MTPYPAILMQGLPGCGKGTQGKMLGADDMFYHCSSGELFRNLDPESDLGQRVTSFISRGDLVPDKVAVRVWAHHIQRSIERGEDTIRPDKSCCSTACRVTARRPNCFSMKSMCA